MKGSLGQGTETTRPQRRAEQGTVRCWLGAVLTGGNVWKVAQGERGTGQAILAAADGARYREDGRQATRFRD